MNTAPLARQRCFNHTYREAVARCTECSQFYCRECIIEHDDRLICAACLRRSAEAAPSRRAGLGLLGAVVYCGLGFVVLWLFFYWCGELLLQIPAKFHEGTVWTGRFYTP